MSKLQKSAWVNLGIMTILTVFCMLCFVFMAKNNAKGIDYIIICFIVGCVSAPLIYVYLKKRGIERNFDEREQLIYKRSFAISAVAMMAFLFALCTIPFFVVGGANVVKVLYLPLIFYSALFAAQFIHSMAIIIQCAMEEENG